MSRFLPRMTDIKREFVAMKNTRPMVQQTYRELLEQADAWIEAKNYASFDERRHETLKRAAARHQRLPLFADYMGKLLLPVKPQRVPCPSSHHVIN